MAVAVSGGADSTALALLLSRWGQPFALIVDHGLRPEAAAEARLAAGQLARFGVPSEVLRLHMRPGPAASERARAARYGALSAACAALGLTDLLVGHHALDQMETVRLRGGMGSGPAGLAGMAGVVHYAHVRVLRPLLGVMPDRLRATLHEAGVHWSEDPGNHDTSNRRAALRQQLLAEGARPSPDDPAGAARHDREQAVCGELGEKAAIHPEGFAHVAAGGVSPGALSALVWAVSGQPHPPSPSAVRRLAAPIRPGTLHGVVVAPAGRLGAGWLLVREAAGAAVPAVDGAAWDGRFRLHGHPPADAMIGALGQVPASRAFSDLPSLVLRTLPALHRRGAILAVPHIGYPSKESCAGYRFSFEPGRPAGPAAFMRA